MSVVSNQLEPTRSGSPILKKTAAAVVLVVVGLLVLHFVLGLVVAVFWIAVIVAVIAAVLWALKTLVW